MSTIPNSRTLATFLLTLVLWSQVWAQKVIRGPYLQIGTPTSIIVRWRTDAATDSEVRFGSSPTNLNQAVTLGKQTTEHEVKLTGLTPDTKYFYAIGTSSKTLAGGDAEHYFITAPLPGTSKPVRIWILGDSGTKNNNQRAVRDAYYNFTGERHTDLWLMLGDNAYMNGEDQEYQLAVFENMYEAMLRKSVLWPTRGNHDRGPKTGSGWTNGQAYYEIFTLPTAGEAGGLPSGTEAYYSFDYGNIHFICLESTSKQLRAVGSEQWTWLEEDLAANTQDWTIAYWHHPPYSRGSHNSDSETELVEMRQRALPILEEGGVDLVFSGHSHSYERSYLLDRHYDDSNTLTDAMILDKGDGREDGDGAYRKATLGPGSHEGAVYTVAGSSGKTSGGQFNHPAMFVGLDVLGSVVLDVDGNKLTSRFIDDKGNVRDYFTIIKGSGSSGPATRLVEVSGNNQTGQIGTALPQPFVVKAVDADNQPVAGVTVTFEVTSGAGTLSDASVVTGGSGRASTVLTLGNTAGTVTVSARAEGLAGSPVLFTATAVEAGGDTEPPAPPTNVRVTGEGQ